MIICKYIQLYFLPAGFEIQLSARFHPTFGKFKMKSYLKCNLVHDPAHLHHVNDVNGKVSMVNLYHQKSTELPRKTVHVCAW